MSDFLAIKSLDHSSRIFLWTYRAAIMVILWGGAKFETVRDFLKAEVSSWESEEGLDWVNSQHSGSRILSEAEQNFLTSKRSICCHSYLRSHPNEAGRRSRVSASLFGVEIEFPCYTNAKSRAEHRLKRAQVRIWLSTYYQIILTIFYVLLLKSFKILVTLAPQTLI